MIQSRMRPIFLFNIMCIAILVAFSCVSISNALPAAPACDWQEFHVNDMGPTSGPNKNVPKGMSGYSVDVMPQDNAKGSAKIFLHTETNRTYIESFHAHFPSPFIGMHIHYGGPNVNGPIGTVFCGQKPLPHVLDTHPDCQAARNFEYKGVPFKGSKTTLDSFAAILLNGHPQDQLYLNYHTNASFHFWQARGDGPLGFIRGQVYPAQLPKGTCKCPNGDWAQEKLY
eukprot:Nk52_evm64s158 gene=Nk52_evmTU64s158